MSAALDINVNVDPAKAVLLQDAATLEKATAAAVNQAAGNANTRLRNKVERSKALTRESIQRRIKVTQRAIPFDPTAVIESSNRTPLLSSYGIRSAIRLGRPASPVRVEVNRGGSRILASGFFVPLRAGKEAGGNGIGIAVRVSVARRLGVRIRKGSSSSADQRAPFTVLRGPSETLDFLQAWDGGDAAKTSLAVEALIARHIERRAAAGGRP